MTGQVSATGVFTFAEVTALAADGPGRFGAEVSREWTIGGKPNGGYLLATARVAVAPQW